MDAVFCQCGVRKPGGPRARSAAAFPHSSQICAFGSDCAVAPSSERRSPLADLDIALNPTISYIAQRRAIMSNADDRAEPAETDAATARALFKALKSRKARRKL